MDVREQQNVMRVLSTITIGKCMLSPSSKENAFNGTGNKKCTPWTLSSWGHVMGSERMKSRRLHPIPSHLLKRQGHLTTFDHFFALPPHLWRFILRLCVCLCLQNFPVYYPTEKGQQMEQGPIVLTLQSVKYRQLWTERNVYLKHSQVITWWINCSDLWHFNYIYAT